MALSGALDVLLGRLGLVDVATGQYHLGGVEAHKVTRRFEAEAWDGPCQSDVSLAHGTRMCSFTNIGAGHDDGPAGAVLIGVRERRKLAQQ